MSNVETMTGSGAMRLLHAHLPGVAFLHAKHYFFGFLLLGYFLLFPVLILTSFDTFSNSFLSLGLSSYLFMIDSESSVLFWRGDVVEYWVAAIFLLAMPASLWMLNRRYLRRRGLSEDEHEMSQWALAWREFKKNRVAVAGMIVIILLYTIVFLCPFLAPHNPNAFQDGVVTKYQPPLTTVTILQLREPRVRGVEPTLLRARKEHVETMRRLLTVNRALTEDNFRRQMAVDAFRVEGANVHATVGKHARTIPIAELAGSDTQEFSGTRFYALGTDSYGRDILSRIIYGSRVSLSLGFIAVLLSITLGTFVGLIAGYFGRFTDNVFMRLVDVLLAFPALFLILIIIAAFENVQVPRIILIAIVLGVTSWMGIARLVRGEVLSIKEREYIMAADTLGFSHARIIIRHILPNALTPIIVNATLRIGGIILVEAALSYLNIGVQQPTASWGNIIFEGKDVLAHAWWVSTLPGFAIVLVVVSFNLLGDGLRDAFDPMLNDERA